MNFTSLIRSARAIVSDPVPNLRAAARAPLEREAAARIAALPSFELSDLIGEVSVVTVQLPPSDDRHGWSLGVAEQLVIQTLVHGRSCGTAFEIGTFNGGTTRLLAEALPENGQVWTIDLPPVEFTASQRPSAFQATDVGKAYRSSDAVSKITQLFGDSRVYDFSTYAESSDIVLVDGGHEYINGVADTRAALQLLRPGGVILWDDFEPYWHGLVNGICDAMAGRTFGRLAGTSLAVYVGGRSGEHIPL